MKAIIFDMDGVLVDSNEAHFEAFRRLGEELGAPFTRELLLKTVGMHNVQIMPLWLGSHLSRDEITSYGIRKEAMYREIAATCLRPIVGAVDLVKKVRANGYKTAVGSSGPRENVALALRKLGLESSFDALVTGSDIKCGKPDPEVFLKAAGQLHISTKDCLVIEDAPSGVQAALNAGMKVVAITTSKPALELNAAHLVIDQFCDLTLEQISSVLSVK